MAIPKPELREHWPEYAELMAETIEAFKEDFRLAEAVAKEYNSMTDRQKNAAEKKLARSSENPHLPVD